MDELPGDDRRRAIVLWPISVRLQRGLTRPSSQNRRPRPESESASATRRGRAGTLSDWRRRSRTSAAAREPLSGGMRTVGGRTPRRNTIARPAPRPAPLTMEVAIDGMLAHAGFGRRPRPSPITLSEPLEHEHGAARLRDRARSAGSRKSVRARRGRGGNQAVLDETDRSAYIESRDRLVSLKQETSMSTAPVKLGTLFAEIVSVTTCRASMRSSRRAM